jgi:hypothetical protein
MDGIYKINSIDDAFYLTLVNSTDAANELLEDLDAYYATEEVRKVIDIDINNAERTLKF